ncbi:hypothetical protein [Lacisediminimonas sp.]|uniref:hypothetical protein n=1 Tax=Lacisediminimonas sp. TaxID=3060582 RepID=UPI00271C4E28|nr:hypothetical protein [Lacisediminimonas sp.]MDO8299546.1 hypothetical protein [Lacisediminimonas sp.]
MTSAVADSAYRQAALKLHGMHRRDRAWLLARCTPAQQERLRALLDELAALGLVCIADADTDADAPPYAVAGNAIDSALALAVNRLPLASVTATIAGMPDRLVAILLHAQAWQWAPALWRQLEPPARQVLLAQISQLAPIAPALQLAVVATFEGAASSIGEHTQVNA